MEGKISREILLLQESILASSPPPIYIAYWTKHFITHLLQIPHAQWVFCNVSLHKHTVGYLHDVKRRKVLHEIDRLSNLDPAVLPADSRYLLRIDFTTLQKSTLAHQYYWLLAIKAAVTERRQHRRQILRFHMQWRSIKHLNQRITIPCHETHNISTGALSSQGTPTICT